MAIRFSRASVRDLEDIRAHTLREFGPVQEQRYLEGLRHHLELLEQFPRSAPLYRRGGSLRVSTYQSHRVFYRDDGGGIAVKRIVHHARDLDRIVGR
ncbi:MAG TPA: type II toxin-antitoxin system RelE/ParE family toxin [Thermoanaerobaculia bacterium]|nr:type II toxin-antitoxin system RelE/ParE family toxin [Thermoanaerobaculia bacterium]